MHRIFAISFGALFLFSCSNNKNTNQDTSEPESLAQEAEKTNESCIYSLDDSKASIYWTAYKHSNRAEVKGQIDSLMVTGKDTDNILDLIRSANITIYPATVNSKDEGRDQKISTFFFGSMEKTQTIKGKIKTLSGTNVSGSGTCLLTLNAVTKEADVTYIVNDKTIELRCSLDFTIWNCEDALSNLQKACEEKHTGIDGKTIFWPDAEILVKADIVTQCD